VSDTCSRRTADAQKNETIALRLHVIVSWEISRRVFFSLYLPPTKFVQQIRNTREMSKYSAIAEIWFSAELLKASFYEK
jgi:hypothetical protein